LVFFCGVEMLILQIDEAWREPFFWAGLASPFS
jgi:hypothetical protein